MAAETLSGGFADASADAAHAFRAALNAMARPGLITQIEGAVPPAPLSLAAGTLLLTLCDGTTPLHLAGEADCPDVRAWLAFHTGAPLVPAGEAQFAVGTWEALHPLEAYAIGTAEYPDRSATLIVEDETLSPEGARLTGPGIETSARMRLPEVAAFQRNAALFPLGLDFYFTAGAQLAALPRTTKVEAA
ncbi:MAG: phosphonate C-P lyase system protein PhnH [Pseudomonadota bacterium]